MKFKGLHIDTLKKIIGGILILHAIVNVVVYLDFLDRLDVYFSNTSLFNNIFLKLTAPLVPFEEFTLGLFLLLGFYEKRTLQVGTVLFLFFCCFLLSAGFTGLGLAHGVVSLLMLVFLFHHMGWNVPNRLRLKYFS